eukprot:1814176-Rhodomonas_salina.1
MPPQRVHMGALVAPYAMSVPHSAYHHPLCRYCTARTTMHYVSTAHRVPKYRVTHVSTGHRISEP